MTVVSARVIFALGANCFLSFPETIPAFIVCAAATFAQLLTLLPSANCSSSAIDSSAFESGSNSNEHHGSCRNDHRFFSAYMLLWTEASILIPANELIAGDMP